MRKSLLRAALAATMMAVLGAGGLVCQPTGAARNGKATRQAATRSIPPVPGPVFDASSMGAPVLLDKGWRVGITADPAAALPGYDDSKWAIRDAVGSMEDVPEGDTESPGQKQGVRQGPYGHLSFPTHRRHLFVWFRLHIRLAPHHGPVALLVSLPVAHSSTLGIGTTGPAVTVFANGQHTLPKGPHSDRIEHYPEISRIYDLNVPESETELTLAVRTLYIPVGYAAYTNFFADRKLRLGSPEDLERSLTLWRDRNLFERLPRLVYSVLLVVLAGFLLALYVAQRGHNEYLWLALHELALAPVGFIELAGSAGELDSLLYAALVLQLMLVSAYLFFEFLISFLALRQRWYIKALRYTAPVLGGIAPTLLLVGHSASAGIALAIVFLGSLCWMAGWLLFMFVTLLAATIRRNFEAGLLLIPLVLSIIGSIEPAMTAGMSDLMGHPYHSPLTISAGPIPIHFASIADFAGVLVIVIIIFGRFLRIQSDQQRATSELAAARTVQELMIPPEKVATPGFEVISVYNPATEVGGDFFHVQTMGDGGVLVVIGDVAGKGLKAAMSVSMIMGALRRTTDATPSHILQELNRVLVGNESFTTCQAAWFDGDGEVVLANAGHLRPYLNSLEVALPGGLPLGVVSEVSYEETRLFLHPGDRLLFFSDGVVEARRPSGELFGFDRMHALATQSAGYIAEAAKSFGQADDITVLTVQRLSSGELKRQPKKVVEILSTAH